MTIKSRTCRSVFTASALILAVGITGFAPSIAVAEPHVRTAPYDFGLRCSTAALHSNPSVHECDDDPSAMLTGAISSVYSRTCIPANTGCRLIESHSAVGIFVDIAEPGTLHIAIDATSFVCVWVGDFHAFFRCGDDPEITIPRGVGQYRVWVGFVHPQDNHVGVVMSMTYELTST